MSKPHVPTPSLHPIMSPGVEIQVVPTSRLLNAEGTDWNEQFQLLLSWPSETIDQKIEREMKLSEFCDKFNATVRRIGSVIIDETNLPVDQKTYPPIQIGGVAGGQKYLVDNIFFKLCIDLFGIYGGDEWSRKGSFNSNRKEKKRKDLNSIHTSCQFGVAWA